MTNAYAAVTTAVTPSSPDRPPTIWPSVPYPDPQAAIDFLVAVFGFEPTALSPAAMPRSSCAGRTAAAASSSADGSARGRTGSTPSPRTPKAFTSGSRRPACRSTRELQDTDYGNRTFTVADPWSVTWSFGTYPGS
jgi:uncharacterized glyoxalase superfamily protein PhnB